MPPIQPQTDIEEGKALRITCYVISGACIAFLIAMVIYTALI